MSMLHLDGRADAARPQPLPIRTRSILAAAGLALHAFLSGVMILACSLRIALLLSVQAHRPVSRAPLRASDVFFLLGARVHIAGALFTAIVFLLWFYRARQNLSAFRSESFEFSPSGVVWSFFIPVVNLVQPYSAMREIWQASDPAIPPFGTASYAAAPVSRLIGVWWALFLARGVISWLAVIPRLGERTHTVATLLSTTEIQVAAYVVSILAALCACRLVLRIWRRQEDFIKLLAVDVAGVF